ncbi:MAG: ribokinase [Propionibacteriaceae bacterium]
MTARVIVVGSINADVTATASPLPRPGETLVGDSFDLVLGGKGSNQAVAAARAEVETVMVGCVGADAFKELTLGALGAEGIDLSLVETVGDRTGIAHIRVNGETGQNDIVIVPFANAELTPERVERLLPPGGTDADADTVLLLQLEVPTATTVRAAQLGRERGWTVILDPAPALTLPEEIWAHVDVVKPNETEAGIFSGVEVTDRASAEQAGRWFVERGVEHVIITRGAQGLLEVSADGATEWEPRRVQAVDSTAAGDSFSGNLAAALAQGRPWEESVRRARAAGTYAVTVAGASPSMPRPADLEPYL